MSEPITPYACSLGTVTAHEGTSYIIATPDGRTIGIAANGVPSADFVEVDIAYPPAPVESEEQIWADFLAGYIADPVTGIQLKANRQARNDFIGQVTLMREALDAGEATGETPTAIWDTHNIKHVLTITDCRALILRYGFIWQANFAALAP